MLTQDSLSTEQLSSMKSAVCILRGVKVAVHHLLSDQGLPH